MRVEWTTKASSDVVIGERLEEFNPREIRKLLIGRYEMRYEIVESTIYIMRVWHTREER